MNGVAARIVQGFAADHAPFGVSLQPSPNPSELLKLSGIKHASAYGLQVALLALAAREAVGSVTGIEDRRAVITNGGPWAAEAAQGFLRTAKERGPQFVVPLVFPATLISAGATATAIAVGAGAAGIGVGHDELAFFEMLRRGRQLLTRRVADQVIVAAASAETPALRTALTVAGRTSPLAECSIAVELLGDSNLGLRMEDAIVGLREAPWPEVRRRYIVDIANTGLIQGTGWPYPDHQFLSAAGAVITQVGLTTLLPQARAGERIVVGCRQGAFYGAGLFVCPSL